MIASKVLFIGGPKDGKREYWPQTGYGYNQLQCAVRVGSNAVASNSPIASSFGVTTHTYTLQQHRLANWQTVEVAVHSSIKDVMQQLVKGYRYHRKPVDPYTRSQRLMRRKIQALHNNMPPYTMMAQP